MSVETVVAAPAEPAAVWLRVAELLPWVDNPREHDEAHVDEIAASIKATIDAAGGSVAAGFGSPLLARAANRELIAGHGRLLAAKQLGLEWVPVRLLDVDDDVAHRLARADNRLTEKGRWDFEKLVAQLTSDRTLDDALLAQQGWSVGQLSALIEQQRRLQPEAERPEEDQAENPASELGACYELGPHRLLCDDSTAAANVERVLGGVEPMLWIFDPPFDVDYSSWLLLPSVRVVAVFSRGKRGLVWEAATFGGDEWGAHELVATGGVRGQSQLTLPCTMHSSIRVWRQKWWKNLRKVFDRDVLSSCGWPTAEGAGPLRPRSVCENTGGVVTGAMSWSKSPREMGVLMAYVPRGSVVWDPCAGGGESLLAAARHGRLWRGCENQPRWVDMIRRRWTAHARSAGVEPGTGALE